MNSIMITRRQTDVVRYGNLNRIYTKVHVQPAIVEYMSILQQNRGRRGRERIIFEFTTTYVISANHHESCELESRSWLGVLDTPFFNKVCQWIATGRWLFPGYPVSTTNITDQHDITEILCKVALNTIILTLQESAVWHFVSVHVIQVFNILVHQFKSTMWFVL
jgi:hypothetical protein